MAGQTELLLDILEPHASNVCLAFSYTSVRLHELFDIGSGMLHIACVIMSDVFNIYKQVLILLQSLQLVTHHILSPYITTQCAPRIQFSSRRVHGTTCMHAWSYDPVHPKHTAIR